MNARLLLITFSILAIAAMVRSSSFPCYHPDTFTFPRTTEIGDDDMKIADNFPYNKTRLPKDIVPEMYTVWLKPDLKNTFDFCGHVKIDLKCVNATKYVILHSKLLNITGFSLLEFNGYRVRDIRMLKNEKNDMILLKSKNDLVRGQKYKLVITFQGMLSNAVGGFYKQSYTTESGEIRLTIPFILHTQKLLLHQWR